jgi:thiosulfate/3-mercaptopyruvate sulfurtransferase
MLDEPISILIESMALHSKLSDPNLRIVELCESVDFEDQRIPGSMHVDYSELVDGTKPVTGQVPSNERLQRLARRLGLRDNLHIVAYDDEGGARASRLVWTLYLLGHRYASVLNGGIHAWLHEGCPVTRTSTAITSSKPTHFALDDHVLATQEYILSRLGAPDLALLDARTRDEYQGSRVLAKRGGHIPGAVHLNWLDTIDSKCQLRLKVDDELTAMLSQRGIAPDREIVVYCQTHHRSAHSWMMLRHLGYSRVRGYPGSWSEWGNDARTPIE